MSLVLYITADRIGVQTGGGNVTFHELEALSEMARCRGVSFQSITIDHNRTYPDPFAQDQEILAKVKRVNQTPTLAHCYAGCLSETVAYLKLIGCKVVYTAAAHNIGLSMEEHQKLGIPFDKLYPHLVEPKLWKQYLEGYKLANALVCPSLHSADVMWGYGCTQRIEVIPHGCYIPSEPIKPQPFAFTVGYLGAYGADKGVRYLLAAWKKLKLRNAVLMLGGRDSTSVWVRHLIEEYGGGNIVLTGWVENVSDFYNACSVVVQPSVSEGFGLEVLEAMAHGRAVLCSTGAGAVDLLGLGRKHSFVCGMYYDAHDVDHLADEIDAYYCDRERLIDDGQEGREQAKQYTWDKIKVRYQALWEALLS